MDAIVEACDGDIQMIDSSSVRVHQHAAGSKRGPDRCMGRSRGGLTTKIHTVVIVRSARVAARRQRAAAPLRLEPRSGP